MTPGRVPGFPQNMEGGMNMGMVPEDDPRPLEKRHARGMRRDWSHVKGLTTIVRASCRRICMTGL